MKIDKNKLKTLRRHVDSYFDGKLIVKSGFKPVDIKKGINWNYMHSNNPKTYQTYLHSLNFINVFVELGLYENDEKLLKETRNIILNWNKTDMNNYENFAWAEHPAAYRIMNIINFQEKAGVYKLKSRIFNKLVLDHCEFLSDEKYYKMNNHGLMMDNALLKASRFIKDENLRLLYKEKAVYRIKISIYRDFSRRGVHLENSPEYHRMVVIIYRKIMEEMKKQDIKIDNYFNNIYKAAIDFKSILIKPNYEYPMLGDTGKIIENSITKQFMDFVDYDAGLAILQKKDKNYLKNSTYLSFKSGYQSKTHKHLDDLSVTYYVDGKDLLIDSGKYSYDINDPIRKYIVSPKAHNTVLIGNKTYKLTNPFIDSKRLKITKYYSTQNYNIITGINKLYNNITVHRTVIVTNNPILIIVDRIIAGNKEKIQQNFNLNTEANILKKSELLYEISLGDTIYNIETFNINKRNIKSSIEGGFVSDNFSNYERNKRIIFEQYSKTATFLTTISRKDLQVKNLMFVEKKLEFDCENNKYSIDL